MAAGLRAEAELLGALARTLRGLTDPSVGVWASPAGEQFGRRVGEVPGVVERVAHRYGVADSALRRLADVLEAAQAEVARSQQVHGQEWEPFIRAGDRMGLAEHSPDPAQRALAPFYRAEMVAHGERVELAVRRHADAVEAFAGADRACAGVLRGLLDDGLADSRLYDALTGTSRVAGEVSEAVGCASLLPPLRPLAAVATAAAGLGLAADTAVRVGYGDGDLASLALTAGATAAGGLGPVLKAGARVTNAPGLATATTRSARRALRVTTRDRLAEGVATTLPRTRRLLVRREGLSVVEPPKPRAKQAWSRPPRSAAALRPWLHEQATVRATQWVRARWVDDLSTVLGADGASVRWHAAGLVADAAARDLRRAGARREEQLDAREEADLRKSGERHR